MSNPTQKPQPQPRHKIPHKNITKYHPKIPREHETPQKGKAQKRTRTYNSRTTIA